MNCPRPTQQYCYWEPDISKDEFYTCWRSYIIYTSASNSQQNSMASSWITTHSLASTTEYSYSTTWDPNASFSTLCDGHARAPAGATPVITTLSQVRPCTDPYRCHSYEINKPTDLPMPTAPSCKIPEKECASLSHAYASMSTSFGGGWYTSQIPFGLWQPPPCTVDYQKYYPQSACQTANPSRVACTLFPGDITMLYWPTTATRDLCATPTGSLPVETGAGAQRTTVYEGSTLTYPTAYMVVNSMRNLQTVSVSGHRQSGWCGPSQSPITLPVAPESASKLVWKQGTRLVTEPVDFRDAKTIAYDAYVEEVCKWGTMRQLVKDDCKTVWGDYQPTLVVPAKATEAAESWNGCNIAQLAQVKKWVALDGEGDEK